MRNSSPRKAYERSTMDPKSAPVGRGLDGKVNRGCGERKRRRSGDIAGKVSRTCGEQREEAAPLMTKRDAEGRLWAVVRFVKETWRTDGRSRGLLCDLSPEC
jgi:hypothetical protein